MQNFSYLCTQFWIEALENISIHTAALHFVPRSGISRRYSDGEQEPELARWYGGV